MIPGLRRALAMNWLPRSRYPVLPVGPFLLVEYRFATDFAFALAHVSRSSRGSESTLEGPELSKRN